MLSNNKHELNSTTFGDDTIEEDDNEQGLFFLKKDKEDELFEYIDTELISSLKGTDRSEFFERIKRYRDRRLGIPQEQHKSFPYDDCSNVVVPIAMSETNGMFAMLKTSFKLRNPFLSVKSNNKDDEEIIKGISAALNILIESPDHINLRKKNNKIFYELGSLGTQGIKVYWHSETRSWKEPDGEGGFVEVATRTKSYPNISTVALEDIFTRTYWDDPQTCPWIAERVYYTKAQLRALQNQGVYQNIDLVLNQGGTEIEPDRLHLLDRLGFAPETTIDTETFAIFEFAFAFDVDDDGVMEEVIAWYDPVSGARCRLEMNKTGTRPLNTLILLEVPGSMYGLGVGGLIDNIQEEINDIHNMRNDSTMLAMLGMLVKRTGLQLGLKTGMRPGKVLSVPDPSKDLNMIKFPDVSMSTIAAEQMLKTYSHEASTVQEDALGMANTTIKTRETFQGQSMRAQNASRIYNAMEESVKEGFSQIGMCLFYQLLVHKEEAEAFANLLPEEFREGYKAALQIPLADVSSRFSFSIQTTEIEKTDEAKRQAYLTLSQLYTMYSEKILQLMQILYANPQQAQIPPQMKEVAQKLIVGATALLEKIMASFGEEDADGYLPYVKDLKLMAEMLEGRKDAQVTQAKQQLKQQNSNQNQNQGELQ